MKTNLADLYRTNPLAACRKALSATRGEHEDNRLEKINSLLELHGTEAIQGDWQNGYWCDIVAVYCNTGETYAPTIIQQRGESSFNSSRFFVSTLGDFIERNQKKLGIL